MTFEEAYDKIKDLPGWMGIDDCRALYDTVKDVTGEIVEIGCYGGRSTFMMAMGSPAHIITIDPFADDNPPVNYDEIYQGFIKSMQELGLENRITLIKKRSQEARINKKIDLLMVDGDHHKKAVLADIGRYVPKIKKGHYALFHDYNSFVFNEYGVRSALEEVKDKYFSEWEMDGGFFRGTVK
jgi:cephalosporin hydroxylase